MNFIIILILEKRNSSRGPNLFEIPQPSLVLFATHETLNSSVIEYVLCGIRLHFVSPANHFRQHTMLHSFSESVFFVRASNNKG